MFSKVAWCVSLKNLSTTSLSRILGELFTDGSCDQSLTLKTCTVLEFLNRGFQGLLKRYGIHDFLTHNEENSANIVEQFNRTIKMRIWRYPMKRGDT